MIKKRVIVDYKNVPDEVLQQLSAKYPHGFGKDIITFNNSKGELVTAVPLEVNDTAYLVKVSTQLQKMVDNYDEDEFSDLLPPELDVDMEDVAKREKLGMEEEEDEGEDSYGDMEDFDDVADDEDEKDED